MCTSGQTGCLPLSYLVFPYRLTFKGNTTVQVRRTKPLVSYQYRSQAEPTLVHSVEYDTTSPDRATRFPSGF